MNIAFVSFLALVLSFLVFFVRTAHEKMGTLLSVCCAVWLLSLCIVNVRPIIEYAVTLSEKSGFGEYMPYVLKSLCIGFFGNVCGEICKDIGEGAIASGLQSVSKLSIIVVCLPLIKEITTLALSYI